MCEGVGVTWGGGRGEGYRVMGTRVLDSFLLDRRVLTIRLLDHQSSLSFARPSDHRS